MEERKREGRNGNERKGIGKERKKKMKGKEKKGKGERRTERKGK